MLTSGMHNGGKNDAGLHAPPRLVALLLALLTLLVYVPVCFHDFIFYDDPAYVLDNPTVQAGLTWAGVKWAFVGWHASNWHPLTWLSHMLDCQLVGPNAGAQHFINVLFHAANAVLLFYLWLRLTGALWPSAMVAALFAWHPLHVESVAWIAERKDVLSTLLGLLATLAYARYAQARRDGLPDRAGRGRSYGWALVFFALSLLAKPMLVTLPCVFLLLDGWPLQRRMPGSGSFAKLLPGWILEKVPFFALAGAACVVTYLAQRGGEAVATLQDRSAVLRLENILVAYLDYLVKSVWPVRLGILYPLPAQYPAAEVALAGAVMAGVSGGVWWWRRKNPWLLTGWLWFVGTLVPVIGLVQVGNQSMADRYTYWPSIGLFVAVVFGLAEWCKRRKSRLRVLAWLAGLVLVGGIALTEKQLRYWRDTKTLFAHTLAVTGENGQAEMMLGVAYERENAMDEAVRHFKAAVTLDSALTLKQPDGNHSLAAHVAWLQAAAAEAAGQAGQAIALYQQALSVDPRIEEAHNNLANLLDDAGDTAGALVQYQAAIKLAPEAATPRENLGTLLLKLGQFDNALQQYREAARLAPADPRPSYLAAKAYLRSGQTPEAIAQLHHALDLDAEDLQSLALLARILSTDANPTNRDGGQAVVLAEKANALAGAGQPFILDVLAMAYAEAGRFPEAQAAANKALDLATANTLTNLAAGIRKHWQLFQSGRPCREVFTNGLAPN